MNIGAIVLAAGGSSRMGTAKQLLIFKGKTLLRRAVEVAVESGCSPVVVVLGQDAERMRLEIKSPPAIVVINSNWQQGIGGSIRVGIEHVEQNAVLDGVMITLCDQPLIDASVLRRLLDVYKTGAGPMVAASYGGTLGVPAIFSKKYFASLRQLPVNGGAKQILMRDSLDVTPFPVDEALMDVDTPADYQRLTT
jgi:molybdenum cofactor cytidylyltransferase